eukprot:40455-Amphidinium_carterae.1
MAIGRSFSCKFAGQASAGSQTTVGSHWAPLWTPPPRFGMLDYVSKVRKLANQQRSKNGAYTATSRCIPVVVDACLWGWALTRPIPKPQE